MKRETQPKLSAPALAAPEIPGSKSSAAAKTAVCRAATLTLAAAAVLALAACDKARTPKILTTPEQRMASGECGGAGPSDRAALGIAVGMPLSQARELLRCYDSDAHFEQGTSGSAANDINKFLRERSAGSSGYANLFIWTRGTTRPCARTGEGDTAALADALQPDDLKFAPWVFTACERQSEHVAFWPVSIC